MMGGCISYGRGKQGTGRDRPKAVQYSCILDEASLSSPRWWKKYVAGQSRSSADSTCSYTPFICDMMAGIEGGTPVDLSLGFQVGGSFDNGVLVYKRG